MTLNNDKKDKSYRECHICNNKTTEKTKIGILKCKHEFDFDCIYQWSKVCIRLCLLQYIVYIVYSNIIFYPFIIFYH